VQLSTSPYSIIAIRNPAVISFKLQTIEDILHHAYAIFAKQLILVYLYVYIYMKIWKPIHKNRSNIDYECNIN